MAVYREGYTIVDQIQKSSKQIFSDACDFGAPVKKGDSLWNASKQLVDWYKDEDAKREVHRYSTGRSVSANVVLMDEWVVSDERKTIEEATDKFRVEFISCTTGACKGFDGYINVQKNKLMDRATIFQQVNKVYPEIQLKEDGSRIVKYGHIDNNTKYVITQHIRTSRLTEKSYSIKFIQDGQKKEDLDKSNLAYSTILFHIEQVRNKILNYA